MSEAPLLELRNVTKAYPGVTPTVVLQGASLRLDRGESLAIVGPSGSGKTTVLNLLGMMDLADSGTVLFEGKPLTGLGPDELAKWRREKAGFVFQQHCLLPQCTALENVLLPALGGGAAASPAVVDRGRRLLERVGLKARADHFPAQLSGGERQRTALVRALIQSPALVLADEPTGALDHANASEVGRLLVELNREEGVSLVVVTHSLVLARKMSRIVSLSDGVFHDGEAADV